MNKNHFLNKTVKDKFALKFQRGYLCAGKDGILVRILKSIATKKSIIVSKAVWRGSWCGRPRIWRWLVKSYQSHGGCFFMSSWRKKQQSDEFFSVGYWCYTLLNDVIVQNNEQKYVLIFQFKISPCSFIQLGLRAVQTTLRASDSPEEISVLILLVGWSSQGSWTDWSEFDQQSHIAPSTYFKSLR